VTASEARVGRRAEREAAKKQRARRGQAIAASSSLIVIGGLVALAVTSPGWSVFRDTFFSWSAFKDSFPEVAKAFWLDIKMFCLIEAAVLIVGLVVALIRTSGAAALFPLRLLSAVYVDVFRGVPVIILIYLVGFGVPALELTGLPSDPIILGGIALTLSYGAYVAEVYRAGIGSIHRGQRDAALAIGLTEGQALRRVILPQAVRRVGPPLLNDFISLQKDVALVSILGVIEAFRQAQIITSSTFNFTPLIGASLLYLCVTIPLSRLLDRWGVGGMTRG
jgi:polar amino acid transport system permease protein